MFNPTGTDLPTQSGPGRLASSTRAAFTSILGNFLASITSVICDLKSKPFGVPPSLGCENAALMFINMAIRPIVNSKNTFFILVLFDF
jgi:hypothetical protein